MASKPWSKQFWTISVWEDEAALMAFTAGGAHKDTMSGLRKDMAATKFVRWKVLEVDVPVTWEVALGKNRFIDSRWRCQRAAEATASPFRGVACVGATGSLPFAALWRL